MMPAASNKTEPKTSPEAVDVSKTLMVVLDKKVRNIEKRKSKLDVIRAKKDAGDTLEKEQQETLKQYDVVVASLDFARDLHKAFNTTMADLEKQLKKQMKREKQEKAASELKRTADILQIQSTLDALGTDSVREHFKTGKYGAVVLTDDNLANFDELYKLISSATPGEENFNENLNTAAEHINSLVEGKDRPVAGSTYKELMDLLQLIIGSGYFERAREAEEEEAKVFSDYHTGLQNDNYALYQDAASSTLKTNKLDTSGPLPTSDKLGKGTTQAQTFSQDVAERVVSPLRLNNSVQDQTESCFVVEWEEDPWGTEQLREEQKIESNTVCDHSASCLCKLKRSGRDGQSAQTEFGGDDCGAGGHVHGEWHTPSPIRRERTIYGFAASPFKNDVALGGAPSASPFRHEAGISGSDASNRELEWVTVPVASPLQNEGSNLNTAFSYSPFKKEDIAWGSTPSASPLRNLNSEWGSAPASSVSSTCKNVPSAPSSKTKRHIRWGESEWGSESSSTQGKGASDHSSDLGVNDSTHLTNKSVKSRGNITSCATPQAGLREQQRGMDTISQAQATVKGQDSTYHQSHKPVRPAQTSTPKPTSGHNIRGETKINEKAWDADWDTLTTTTATSEVTNTGKQTPEDGGFNDQGQNTTSNKPWSKTLKWDHMPDKTSGNTTERSHTKQDQRKPTGAMTGLDSFSDEWTSVKASGSTGVDEQNTAEGRKAETDDRWIPVKGKKNRSRRAGPGDKEDWF